MDIVKQETGWRLGSRGEIWLSKADGWTQGLIDRAAELIRFSHVSEADLETKYTEGYDDGHDEGFAEGKVSSL